MVDSGRIGIARPSGSSLGCFDIIHMCGYAFQEVTEISIEMFGCTNLDVNVINCLLYTIDHPIQMSRALELIMVLWKTHLKCD